ncbi:MAG: sigma-70 family RNA polymerase sigma factor [Alphaproteobacteria bacterium]|nr:sigma-70 family RNA polymerase sigma factor [Alphaproteobacteria bacterium]
MDGLPHPPASLLTDPFRRQLTSLLPDLRGFARFLVRERAEADDLVQEALVRALSAAAQFRPGTNMKSWVFTILRNAFYEQARRHKTERAALERAARTGPAPVSGPDEHSEIADLERRLWDLPPLLREALVLVGAQEMSYEEAAEICAVPVGTMKARVSRARAQIRERIADALPAEQ